jgi:predicted aspartyl protease
MPIRDYAFIPLGGILRPWLPVKIINPHTGLFLNTYGLIDTGADECCIPKDIAEAIGHDVMKGVRKDINGVGGIVSVYAHTTQIEIYNPSGTAVVHTINKTCIDCGEHLSVVLLGVKQFLDNFKLKVDYPAKTFSITAN